MAPSEGGGGWAPSEGGGGWSPSEGGGGWAPTTDDMAPSEGGGGWSPSEPPTEPPSDMDFGPPACVASCFYQAMGDCDAMKACDLSTCDAETQFVMQLFFSNDCVDTAHGGGATGSGGTGFICSGPKS